MAKKATVISFGERIFFFYPQKVKEGYVNVFNYRNQCIGRAPVRSDNEIVDQVEAWILRRNVLV